MSVSSTTSKAGPFSCNGVQTVFPFAFKTFTKYDVRVVLTDALGTEVDLVVDTNYTVALNVDQNNSPGGSITALFTYAAGYKLTLVGNISPTQLLSITNFRPDVIEKAFDKLTLLVQQLYEKTSRAFTLDISDTGASPGSLLDYIVSGIASAAASASAAAASAVSALASKVSAENAAAVIDGFSWQNSWVTGHAYTKNNLAYDSGNTYIALINHTSSAAFATDLGLGRWALFALKGAPGAGTGDLLAVNNLTEVNPATARSNLSAAKTGSNGDITALTALSTLDAVTVTLDSSNDFLYIVDVSDGNKIKKVLASSLSGESPGFIKDFGGIAAPAGYLLCDGSAVSRATYAALFTAIGTTWGIGNGSTTFNVPNFAAGEAAVQNAGTVGAATVGEVIAHTHTIQPSSQGSGGSAGVQGAYWAGGVTGSTGGTKNKAAGQYVLKCIKY